MACWQKMEKYATKKKQEEKGEMKKPSWSQKNHVPSAGDMAG